MIRGDVVGMRRVIFHFSWLDPVNIYTSRKEFKAVWTVSATFPGCHGFVSGWPLPASCRGSEVIIEAGLPGRHLCPGVGVAQNVSAEESLKAPSMLVWSTYLRCAIRQVQLSQRQATIQHHSSQLQPFQSISPIILLFPDELPHFQAATDLHSVPENPPTSGSFIWMQLYPMHVVSCDRLMRTSVFMAEEQLRGFATIYWPICLFMGI